LGVTSAGVAEHSVGLLGIEIRMQNDINICLLKISIDFIAQSYFTCVCIRR